MKDTEFYLYNKDYIDVQLHSKKPIRVKSLASAFVDFTNFYFLPE